MTETAALAAPQVGEASVVFVRPDSSCDRDDYAVIVDDHGRFVGNVAPGTRVSVPVKPGTHTFFAWSSLDLRIEKEPNYNPVSATRVNVIASQTAYVALHPVRHHFECFEYSPIEMATHEVLTDEVQGWLNDTKPVVADRAAGQVKLNARPALLQTDLELGQIRLQRTDEQRAREERRDAIAAELR